MPATQERAQEASGRSYWDTHKLASGLDRAFIEFLSGVVTVRSGARDTALVQAPFTGELLGVVPRCTVDDVAEAVRGARAGQQSWARTSFARRRSILLHFHDLLLKRQQQIMDLIQLETGKARRHALEEVLDTAVVARHYAVHAKQYLRPHRHRGALPLIATAWEYRHPIGVVGFIAPWNFPLILSVTDLIAALAAGNAAVLRPDLQSSFTALWAVRLLHEAGVPPEVLQVVTGSGSELGPAIFACADFIMFTGSTPTGRTVARYAAERLIGCSLELGGKNPMIVLPDADLDGAVDGLIRGAFVGAGQVCMSIERAYVHSAIFDEFTSRLLAKVQGMTLSAALDFGADMGSLTTSRQLAVVKAHVQDAIDKGAVLLAGGRARPALGPLFYEPTVLAGVMPGMKVYAEETFGPVVSLYRFNSVDEAIDRANDTAYGLSASIWSKNTAAARRLATRIRAGSVNVNEAYATAWSATRAPIGGMKQSGLGRRHGAEGILKYTETQTVALQRWLPFAPPPFLAENTYAKVMSALVSAMRHIPGLR
jgi:acyl-CoA reductase-like NAD-dependent aldehyde dehydrogenase